MSAKPTPIDRERARLKRLQASLAVPKFISIATPQPAKAKPAMGKFASA